MLNEHFGILDNMFQYITWQDIYNSRIIDRRTGLLLQEFKPNSLKELIHIISCALNIYAWEDGTEQLIDMDSFRKMYDSEEFQRYPCYTREDVVKHMVTKGFDEETAFSISEMVRKGYAHSSLREKYDKILMPQEIKSVTDCFKYLTFRERAEKMSGYILGQVYANKMKLLYVNTFDDVELISDLI